MKIDSTILDEEESARLLYETDPTSAQSSHLLINAFASNLQEVNSLAVVEDALGDDSECGKIIALLDQHSHKVTKLYESRLSLFAVSLLGIR
jgi:hypothetical protein